MKELTAMQAAYWVGRQTTGPLGGVAAHLYAEFDGSDLDPERLSRAVKALFAAHERLRLCLAPDGRQTIVPMGDQHRLFVEDFREWDQEALVCALAAKRKTGTHQRLDLEHGQAVELSLSLLPEGRCRFHVDMDMVAADPSCFRALMEDLARFYLDPAQAATPPSRSYTAYLAALQSDASAARRLTRNRDRDRRWWQARLAQIPPAPPLPWKTETKTGPVHSDRFAAWLSVEERQALEQAARQYGLTLSTLLLSVFALMLGAHTRSKRFRLNVPLFHRRRCVEDVDLLMGDFSDVLILCVELDPEQSLCALARRLATELAKVISHSTYSGVSVMRDLSRAQGGLQVAPVVFTGGVNMPGGELFSQRVTQTFGDMTWVISQAPHVALDAQVATFNGGLLINWDVRLDALPEAWIRPFFDDYLSSLRRVLRSSYHMSVPLRLAFPVTRSLEHQETEISTPLTPLTPLQRAYLMGRTCGPLPLGGVAMQEFREYRGYIAADELRRRLVDLVQKHEALRTRIDDRRLTQWVEPEGSLNLEERDLRDLSVTEAWQRIDALREDYAHHPCDLSRPPWRLLLLHLPATSPDSHVLFACFDALILDGHGIATILTALLTDHPVPDLSPPQESSRASSGSRQSEIAYWTAKLGAYAGPPQLPWLQPLETIKTSRYRREQVEVDKTHVTALTRLAAKSGIFRNTLLSTLLLEVLAQWCNEGSLCIAVPVAFPHGERLGNASTFIPLLYDTASGSLEDRARQVQTDILEGLEHVAVSGVELNRLLLSRSANNPPLPVVLTNALSWPRLKATDRVQQSGGLTQTPQTAMDIRLTYNERGNLELCLDYAERALSPALARDLLQTMGRALESIASRQSLTLDAHQVLGLSHYRHNGSKEDFICSGFLQRIARNLFETEDDKAALICGEDRISYNQLGQKVSALIEGFPRWGIHPGSVVANCLPRSVEHVAVTLACALTGVIWVPVDATAPPDRLQTLLDTCHPSVVVGRQTIEGVEVVAPEVLMGQRRTASPSTIPVDLEFLAQSSRSEAPAYILFTSGTTGKPKGVVLCNRATSNVIGRTQQAWQVGPRDVFLSVTPLHHDMSVFDLFGALSAGATLVLPAPDEEKNAIAWNRLVKTHGVTLWCSVPAILEMLLACRQGDELTSLRLIAQGGDYIKPSTITTLRALLPTCRLFSLGGPTETTIWSIWHELEATDQTIIPYGRPLPGSQYFLLNDKGEHCPVGVTGRIHTAGVSVALGYMEDGTLSQTDFVTINDEHGYPLRAFRTGDLGRYRDDGTLLFAGRVNGYVKVRGIRVSLPDIENELAKHDAVHRVLVVDYGDARTGVVALGALYVGAEATAAALREFARRHLPDSHVPSRFVRVEDLPLSANGKPDRARARALLLSTTEAPAPLPQDHTPSPSRSQEILEIYLATIGAKNRRSSGPPDEETPFIDLGLLPSHLRAIGSALHTAFGVELSPGHLARCRNARQVENLLPNTA